MNPELKIGKRFCQCGECGEYFNSPGSFDRHRISLGGGGRGCETTKKMLAVGFHKNAAGYWAFGKMDKDVFNEDSK